MATGLGGFNTLAIDGAGDLFIADPKVSRVLKVTPDGTQSTVGMGLSQPQGVAADGEGNVFIADGNNDQVVEVPAVEAPSLRWARGYELSHRRSRGWE